jgi:galactose-1-phosphate uridylyltransferase
MLNYYSGGNMELKKIHNRAVFLDPFNGFNEGGRECEIRTDPLTGRNSRILFFPLRDLPEPDLSHLLEKNPSFCPFCPENVEKITPAFNPYFFSLNRFRVNEAVCFPNAFPYDENGAVTVIMDQHFVTIDEFTAEKISDAVKCCVKYLKEVKKSQPDAVYQSINWNYLPLAGSSILHPHLQVTASNVPTNYYTDVFKTIEGSRGNIFTELRVQEKKLNERFISEGNSFDWFTAFAPQGAFDVIGMGREFFDPAELVGDRLDELCEGIVKTMKFIKTKNMYSFNMSLFFAAGNKDFIPHLRMCPRTDIPPLDTSEINYMKMLHNEPMSTMKPEEIARELREFWK